MAKFAGIVEYDGSGYCGWQRQQHAPSVQQAVENAISQVANHKVATVCAGRTDTGVHALGQVIHFESDANRSLRSWLLGINSNLPPSIVLKKIRPVPDAFHARFSARSRSYRYIIYNNVVRSALLSGRACWERLYLDAERMQKGANYLLGEHDFTSYRALSCQAHSAVRTIKKLEISRQNLLISIDVTANAFLHHMVRNISGVLMSIGKNEQEPEWARQVLINKDRASAGITAPSQGLYFISVEYEPKYTL